MPPKQGSGKKKLSKAEKEKMKKEEAERKAQEEEEARLLAEQEQKEMKKREKLQEIERKKLELEEKKYRKIKMAELNEMLDGHKSALKADNDHRRKTSKWERYMRTDGSPDPTVQGEINTYINLRREDNTANDIDSVLRDGKLDLELIEELEFLLEDNPEETLTPSDVAEYKHTISELQDLLKLKLDAASHQILLKATALQDPETLNLQFCQRSDQISLCVWGNLCKNPRVKSFEFSETGFMFEIPKQLTLAECAFRILSTKYDHYSLYCKTFMPRIRKPEEPEPKEPEAVNQTEEVENGEGQGEELAEGEEPKPEEEEPEKEDTMDLMASLREANTVAEDEEGGEGGEEERPEDPKEEEDEWTDPVTPEPTEWDDFDGDDDEVDLRAYHVIGGVFDFNLLHLPPQPKTVNSWTMTQMVIPPELMYMDYVAELSAPVAPSPSKEVKEGQEEKKRDEKPPIGVTMRLAEDVFFMEEPQVARWDHDNKCWKLDGFTDIKYFDDERKLKFKANGFGTMALLQDFHINMPFQSWEIRPHNANSCVLTIIAAIVELEIEIKGAECCLSKPDDRPELKHLLNKWMQPSDLIKCMQAAGVNVFPAEDSSKYVSIQEKSPIVEERLYEQMALTCAGMAYSWSKWNSECGDRDWILFQGAEAIEDEPLLEEDWSLYLVTKRRAMKLKMTEYDETFSDILADNTDCNLYHLMKFTASEKVNERIEAASYQYIHCVQQVLSATKFLTFA